MPSSKVYGNEFRLTDGYGNPIGSFRGAIDIHNADVHREIVNRVFHLHTGVITTFAADAPAGSTEIELASATGFAVNDYMHIENGVVEQVHPRINSLVGTTATLDRPLDNEFVIGDSIEKSILSMNVLGSLASPVSFKVIPSSSEVMHLTRILIEMTHGTAGDNGLFGDLPALLNGVVLRRYDGTTGTYATFTNWKTNSDIVTDTGDVNYAQRSSGGGEYGTNSEGKFSDAGAIVYLDGSVGDYIEVLIQDDLTQLNSFRIKAQGHFEGD